MEMDEGRLEALCNYLEKITLGITMALLCGYARRRLDACDQKIRF